MDMNTSTSDGAMMVMMTPFFHFIGGDYLIFESWKPTSPGAIAGACIGLFVLALFERWVNAISPVILDHLWQRALRRIPTSSVSKDMSQASSSRRTSSDTAEVQKLSTLSRRTIPPFIAMVDIPRGILYAFQRLLGFAMMLSVMTFHAGYIISIIAGLGLGEMLFGRATTRVVKPDH